MVFFCICRMGCMGYLDFWVGIWDVGHTLYSLLFTITISVTIIISITTMSFFCT